MSWGSGVSKRRGALARACAVTALVGTALVGCQAGKDTGRTTALPQTGTAEEGSVSLQVTPSDGTKGVLPTDRVRVTSKDGVIKDVVVVGSTAPPVRGSVADGEWLSAPGQTMTLGAEYHVYALVDDSSGHTHSVVSTFHTVASKDVLKTLIAPLNGETVGVGMPVMVIFTAKVKDRAAVERRLSVDVAAGDAAAAPIEGAWHWFSDKEVHFRPREFWPAHSDVTVNLKLAGVNAGNGVRGLKNRTVKFTVGSSHISLVDAVKHNMVVKEDGKVVRELKVSTGRPKYPSQSGIHVVIAKANPEIMDSATVGIPRKSPDGYYEKVPWSTRISYSGEFVHAAAWSVRDQGVRNVSHGCVNISPAEAEWFYHFSKRGDVVNIINTPRPYRQGAGFQEWTFSWDEWKAGSALAS